MGVSGVLQPPQVAVSSLFYHRCPSLRLSYLPFSSNVGGRRHENGRISGLVSVNKEDTPSTSAPPIFTSSPTQEQSEQGDDPDSQDLEYVSQIKRVKLTIMIEDPRDVERRRLLGIDDENAPTRDDLAAALVQVIKSNLLPE
ncbi:hypothetical protein DH2020_047707 [Rehmannia glutinosa]|uniref:Uncharacterized protein n=1 Tax=Rehmannia glutinosa TaxID=99300 RepID=A0ABR0U7V3_REHGL